MLLLGLDLWKKKNKRRWLRFLFYFLLCISLFGLANEPQTQEATERPKAILLTENANPNWIDSLQQSYPKAEFFSTEDSLFAWSQFQEKTLNTDSVFILGNGLSTTDFHYLDSLTIINLLNPLPDGIIDLHFSTEIALNESFEVVGNVKNTNQEIQDVSFVAFGEEQESINLTNDELTDKENSIATTNFFFSKKMEQSGKFIFELHIKTATDTGLVTTVEKLPFTVTEENKLNILWLSSAPNFESKYLKKWLSEEGHTLSIRSQLTTERYRYEFLNAPTENLDKLNKTNLNNKDLLLVDFVSLQSLNDQETKTLSQFTKNGLSVLVLMNNKKSIDAFRENQPKLLSNVELRKFKSEKTNLLINGETISTDNKDWIIAPKWNQISVVEDEFKNTFVAYQNKDLGKVGLSVLGDSYPLILEGKQEAYHELWTSLLSQFGKKYVSTNRWKIKEYPLVFPLAASEIQLMTSEPFPEGFVKEPNSIEDKLANSKGVEIYFAQHTQLPEWWTAKYWFKQSGWHGFQTEEESKSQPNKKISKNELYVFDKEDWKTMRIARQIKNNEDYLKTKQQQNFQPFYKNKSISQWWFYALFLLSVACIWIEEKF